MSNLHCNRQLLYKSCLITVRINGLVHSVGGAAGQIPGQGSPWRRKMREWKQWFWYLLWFTDLVANQSIMISGILCYQVWLIVLYFEISCGLLWFIGWYVTCEFPRASCGGRKILVSPGFHPLNHCGTAGENPQETHRFIYGVKTNSGIGMDKRKLMKIARIKPMLRFNFYRSYHSNMGDSQVRKLDAEPPPNQPFDFMDQDDSKRLE